MLLDVVGKGLNHRDGIVDSNFKRWYLKISRFYDRI